MYIYTVTDGIEISLVDMYKKKKKPSKITVVPQVSYAYSDLNSYF